jgi:hypothetical protein
LNLDTLVQFPKSVNAGSLMAPLGMTLPKERSAPMMAASVAAAENGSFYARARERADI